MDDGTPLYGPLSIPEVIAHEWTHVIIRRGGAVYSPFDWPGALEEAICDAFACFIKKEVLGSDTWYLLAEDTFRLKVGKVRAGKNMMDPLQGLDPAELTPEKALRLCLQGHQAAHMSQCVQPFCDERDGESNDNGWVHVNSGVMNRATYLMLNGSTDPTDPFLPIGTNVLANVYYCIATKHHDLKDNFGSFGVKVLTDIFELYEKKLDDMIVSGERKDALQEIANWRYTVKRAFDLVGIKVDGGKRDLLIPEKFPGPVQQKVKWLPEIRK
jgi:Zn-dependent metalloprotease